MKALTNSDILTLVKTTPTYKRWTSKLTDDIFTTEGFEEFDLYDRRTLEDFFNLSVRVVLNKIRTANPRIPSIYSSIVEEYASIEGGIAQRINILPIKPTSPRYRNLKDGDSVDRWTVRKPKTDERFYGKNFDFQNFISLQEINLKQMFLKETGIFTYVEGITKTFNESYYIQKFAMLKEMLSLAINSTQNPLKDTQKLTVKPVVANDLSTQEEFYRTIQNFGAMMDAIVMSKDFNAKSFEHGMQPSEYVLMVRYNTWNLLLNNLKAPSFMKDSFGLPFKVELVDNFGGIEFHYQTSEGDLLLPVYKESTGEQIGFNTTGGYGTESDIVAESDVVAVDPNKDIVAVIAQKGVIFSTTQNPYTVRNTGLNEAGLYYNIWADQPNGSFNYDACYDIITITEDPNANRAKK